MVASTKSVARVDHGMREEDVADYRAVVLGDEVDERLGGLVLEQRRHEFRLALAAERLPLDAEQAASVVAAWRSHLSRNRSNLVRIRDRVRPCEIIPAAS